MWNCRRRSLFVGSFVDDQVGLILVAQQRLLADSSRVRVLVDVALAASVDENTADHQLGVAEECDLGGVHVREVGPESLRHLDGLSVVLFDSRTGAPDQPWGVRLDHRFVVGEASRRQYDTRACSNCHFLAVLLGDDADHSISVDDQALDSHVVFCSYAEAFGRLDQWLHQHETTALLPGALAAHL